MTSTSFVSESLHVYDSILQTIGKTPLIQLKRIGSQLRSPLYAKVEFFNPGGSISVHGDVITYLPTPHPALANAILFSGTFTGIPGDTTFLNSGPTLQFVSLEPQNSIDARVQGTLNPVLAGLLGLPADVLYQGNFGSAAFTGVWSTFSWNARGFVQRTSSSRSSRCRRRPLHARYIPESRRRAPPGAVAGAAPPPVDLQGWSRLPRRSSHPMRLCCVGAWAAGHRAVRRLRSCSQGEVCGHPVCSCCARISCGVGPSRYPQGSHW